MKNVVLAAAALATVLSIPVAPAHAGDWEGLAGGLAGGLIAGAIIANSQPHVVYVPVQRHVVQRHVYVAPRRAPARVVVVHERTVVAPAPVTVVHTIATPAPVAAPAAPMNNNNIVVAPAPAPAPIIINNSPAPAPTPIVINTAAPAPAAAPTPAAVTPVATTDRCQQDFAKTADYLACVKGVAAK